jgi:hypothetical protein
MGCGNDLRYFSVIHASSTTAAIHQVVDGLAGMAFVALERMVCLHHRSR